jgi:16S rRNA processing protein RimM
MSRGPHPARNGSPTSPQGGGGDILLAAIIGAHGLKGEVRAKLFTTSADRLGIYGAVHTREGRVLNIASARDAKPGEAILSFKGIADRDAAEALKGTEICVSRDALPALDPSEFYHADLVGLSAYDRDDRLIGKVTAIHNFGAGDVIEIERPDGDTTLLAFTRENVPEIDVQGGRVQIAVPEEVEARKSVE